jgi:hypothetical protein
MLGVDECTFFLYSSALIHINLIDQLHFLFIYLARLYPLSPFQLTDVSGNIIDETSTLLRRRSIVSQFVWEKSTSVHSECQETRIREKEHPFFMATPIPSEVSNQANQHELGEFRQRHTSPGARLPCSVSGRVVFLLGLIIIFTPEAKIAGLACVHSGAF